MRALVLILCAAVMGGCGSGGKDPTRAAGDVGDDRKFEEAREPAVSGETHFAAGQFAETQGNVGKAIEQYRAAVKVKPDHQGALYRLGVLCTQAKLYAEAVGVWKKYIDVTGGAAVGYSNLGFTYQLSGDLGAAAGAYDEGIKKEPRNRPCRVNYGLMLAREGKFDSAIEQWNVVLTPAEVQYNLGSVHEMRGEKEQARVAYRKAVEAEPKMGEAKARLAQLDKE